ncbi:MAG: HAMP domain-containing histidine kinase [Marinifilum sp.]|jgi:signal transduction histidine kinase|nr:HAMP domain-containing histidine kinase [Marinifilum sp.]
MKKRPTYKELQRQLQEAKVQLKKTEKLKDAFLANMSHEIRTPMNAIVGASELLRDDSLSPKDRNEFTKILSTSSKELLDLFNKILELSQLESGALEYNESEVEVHELLVTLYSSYAKKISMSGKNLVLNYTEDLRENKIFTDYKKLIKVLSYLLDNAIKFTNSGEIDFGCAIQDIHNILFYVKDTGLGVSDKQQAEIFQKFTQVDNSYTREHSGAGLGLSISKEIVEFLGGKLYIDSNLGNGSIFYFTIPFKFPESDLELKEKIKAILKQNINEIYSSPNTRKDIAI